MFDSEFGYLFPAIKARDSLTYSVSLQLTTSAKSFHFLSVRTRGARTEHSIPEKQDISQHSKSKKRQRAGEAIDHLTASSGVRPCCIPPSPHHTWAALPPLTLLQVYRHGICSEHAKCNTVT